MNNEDADELMDDKFPWPDVDASRNDLKLQRKHSVQKAKRTYLAHAQNCPICDTIADQLAWFYFSSPDETWEHLCGRAGWLTVCDRCHVQVDFFCEVLN